MKSICFLVFFACIHLILIGQEAIITSGSNSNGVGGSSSYTIGQVVYTTNFSETGSSAQGVQHPNLEIITDLLSLDDTFNFSIYPNPTIDQLHLSVDAENYQGGLYFKLYNIEGKTLLTEEMIAPITQINMSPLAAATYILEIHNGADQRNNYKIIKLK